MQPRAANDSPLTAGGAWCWGTNHHGHGGGGTKERKVTSPVNDVGLDGATRSPTALALGEEHVLARTSAPGIKSWGANILGQLGDGTTADRSRPVDVVGYCTALASAISATNTTAAPALQPALNASPLATADDSLFAGDSSYNLALLAVTDEFDGLFVAVKNRK